MSTLRECTFSNNAAEYYGGGAHFESDNTVVMVRCDFLGNSTVESAGGGLSLWSGCDARMVNCRFIGNAAFDSGGGVWAYNLGLLRMMNCLVARNWAGSAGGMYCGGSGDPPGPTVDPYIVNCTFADNLGQGGGMTV